MRRQAQRSTWLMILLATAAFQSACNNSSPDPIAETAAAEPPAPAPSAPSEPSSPSDPANAPTPVPTPDPVTLQTWKKITRTHQRVSGGGSVSEIGSTLSVSSDGAFELNLQGGARAIEGSLTIEELTRLNEVADLASKQDLSARPSCASYDRFAEDPVFSTNLNLAIEDGVGRIVVTDNGATGRICTIGDARVANRLDAVLEGIVVAYRR